MTTLTFDLETQSYAYMRRKGSPFDPRNYIVEAGWKINNGPVQSKRFDSWHREDILVDELNSLVAGDTIVGFNIKFDLLWIWNQPSLKKALKRGVKIYCGQYAEYLLGGMTQDVQMCAMNDIAGKYGGGDKVDAVKEMWDAGILTSDIPADLLHDYLCGTADGRIVGDVENTYRIFRGQLKVMKEQRPPQFIRMVKNRMEGLLATTECEFNGLRIDLERAEELRTQILADIDEAKRELDSFIPELPPELEFSWASPIKKSALIFGGAVKYKKWEQHVVDGVPQYAQKKETWPVFLINGLRVAQSPDACVPDPSGLLTYHSPELNHTFTQLVVSSGKNKGNPVTRQVAVPDLDKPKGALKDHIFRFPGYVAPQSRWRGETQDADGAYTYSVAAEVIEELAALGLPFTNALGRYTALTKDLGTYYYTEDGKGGRKGMLTLVGEDAIIHHSLNHTNTVTTRLSANNPNMQNIPKGSTSNVKEMFISRFPNGLVAEIDYSQLEVVVQGVLTRDKQLIADLLAKVDFHCKRLAATLGEPYADVLRKAKKEEIPEYVEGRNKAKVFSFQRAYGAGAAKVAATTGMTLEEVQALIEAEEALYPGVKAFEQMLEQIQISNRVSCGKKIFINGTPFNQARTHWDSPTGTRFVWEEGQTPDFMHKHGKYVGFSPTERKNYPVQGVGGEIVQTMLGRVFRYLLANDNFGGRLLMTNTVHDCAWFDGHADVVTEQIPKIQKIMESVREVYNEMFPELDILVPFPCEAEVGPNMKSLKVLH